MIIKDSFHSNVNGKKFFNYEEDMKDFLPRLKEYSVIKDFFSMFRLTDERFMELYARLGFHQYNFMDYSFSGVHLLYPSGMYEVTYSKYGGRVVKYYDVYSTISPHVSCHLNRIANVVIREDFPELFEGVFLSGEKRRFGEDIEKLSLTPETLVDDLDGLVLLENHVTIQELFEMFNDSSYKYRMVGVPRVSVYYEGNMYVKCENDKSISLNVDMLYGGDWKGVEDFKVYWDGDRYMGDSKCQREIGGLLDTKVGKALKGLLVKRGSFNK